MQNYNKRALLSALELEFTDYDPTLFLYNHYYQRKMLALLKPIVLTFLKSDKFKFFIVDILEKLVEQSDNTLDDKVLVMVKKGLDIE